MLLGQVFQSIQAWQKLSAIPLKPKIAYRVLKYTKKVSSEHELAEKQRVALIHEVTGTLEGQDAKIEPNTPEFQEYATRFNAIMALESDLEPIDMELQQVVDVLDDKEESLSMSDLAVLEPFFKSGDEPKKGIEEAAGETS